MPMPDGTLTDHECRVELLKLGKFLDEHHADDVKKNPADSPADLAIRLLQTPIVCTACGHPLPWGPFCAGCQ